MRIFVDTNILLDVYLHRAGEAASQRVLLACVSHGNEGWIAWHSLSNGFYIVQRESKQLAAAKQFIADLLVWADVASVGTAEAKTAQQLPINDFEDALQIASALSCNADIIVTRNTTDFALSPIPAISPEQFVISYPSL